MSIEELVNSAETDRKSWLMALDAESCVSDTSSGTWPIWDSAWLTLGMTYRKALWPMLLMNGAREFRLVWMKKEEILNTCYSILGWVQTGCVDKLDVLLVCATKKCNLFGKVIIFATDFFCKVVQQQYIDEVGKAINVMLQINPV